MKLSTAVITLVASCLGNVSMALDNGPVIVDRELQFGDLPERQARNNANGNGNGNANGNGQGHGPPDFVLAKFNQDNQVKPGRTLPIQEVTGNLVNVAGRSVSFVDSDLTPKKVFAPGARVFVDGAEVTIPPLVFESKSDSSITITKGTNGRLLSASKRGNGNGRGAKVDVLPVQDDFFAELDADDISDELLAEFTLADAQSPNDRRFLRSSGQLKEQLSAYAQARSLATLFDTVEVDIVLDSYFCAAFGGNAEDAQARAISIVADASAFYQSFGVQIVINTFSTFCDPAVDPIRTIFDGLSGQGSSDVCGGANSLLVKFKDHVANEGTFKGDLVHLFHAFDFSDTSVIGCAYEGALCNSWYYHAGVNEMAATANILNQAKLFAHEAGHNLGAPHDATEGYIMQSYLCGSSCSSFSPASITDITSSIINAPSGCIHEAGVGPTPAPAPTPAPVCTDDDSWTVNVCSSAGCQPEGCDYFAASYWRSFYCDTYSFIAAACPLTCDACP
ncbi:Reprolysin (M12B) family zinc metalloprotease [Seminavis robusta]|uniref:Reprolysin (M12B) family zinc metalloprotease n=1 Tax=Seminavis robusta TaxID=568900 RepID=A0A9N8E2E7_9STRA|nr:Reprolysin (M12B) family zinc metalloprotease [Seminavis robusta]|eukprot:Sro585_g170910.1 Reprolysin (M12B) family zinc metalloprotease (506) ;mRNA; f:4333-5936